MMQRVVVACHRDVDACGEETVRSLKTATTWCIRHIQLCQTFLRASWGEKEMMWNSVQSPQTSCRGRDSR